MDKVFLPDFKVQKTTILQLPDGKWSIQLGCPTYRFIFDTHQEMLAQYIAGITNPEKWSYDNKIEMGNKRLKEVDLHVISKYIENK
jgi:hypothetical protein